MYHDMADAVESLKEKGFTHLFELGNTMVNCSHLDRKFNADELRIVESYTFDKGTDPGSESTLYAIESEDGIKGILTISFGIYSDPNKAKLIDRLLQADKDNY